MISTVNPVPELLGAPGPGRGPALGLQRAAIRHVIAPILLLGLGVVALILALVTIAAQSQNRLAIESTRHLAGSALRVEREQIAGFLRDYAIWNDAAAHLVEAFDPAWADDNVGAWANDSLGMSAALVLDSELHLIFGSLDGTIRGNGLLARMSGELPGLVSRALDLAGEPGSVPGTATTYLELDGAPAIAVAAVIKWEDDRPIPQHGGMPVVLVFVRRVDEAMLKRFEELYLLPDLRLAAAAEDLPASVPLRTVDDRVVARLGWVGQRPGTALILDLVPSLAGIAALAGLLVVLIVRRARRSTAELASSHQQLESQARALRASTVAMQSALAEAARANAAKSDFLARMSHELRTPLNAILGFSEIIALELYGPNSDPRYRDYGRMIHESGDHLRSLINDILDLSRIEAGRHELKEEPTSVDPIIEQCLGLLAPKIEAKRIAVDHVPSAVRLLVDIRALKQILLNLLSNAVKFTDGGGLITVRVRDGDDGITVEISDTGCGMSDDDLERVFQLFGQVRATTSRDGEGSGLGLNIAKALVEMHGGELGIRSAVGVGTTASVWFDPSRRLPAVPVTDVD